uniref:Uncharacterized protein n=1 Tax=Panagrellus redivivus TaxID=6233 RepID=A0A7E4ULC5_PANRE
MVDLPDSLFSFAILIIVVFAVLFLMVAGVCFIVRRFVQKMRKKEQNHVNRNSHAYWSKKFAETSPHFTYWQQTEQLRIQARPNFGIELLDNLTTLHKKRSSMDMHKRASSAAIFVPIDKPIVAGRRNSTSKPRRTV